MNKLTATKLVQDYFERKGVNLDVIYHLDEEPIEIDKFWVFKNLQESRETMRGSHKIVNSLFPGIIVNKLTGTTQEINRAQLDKVLDPIRQINEYEIIYQELEFGIHISNKFLGVLSDGYNPVSISIDRRENDTASEDELMKLYSINSQLEYGWESKLELTDLHQKINENFQWLYMHLQTFNEAPKIFSSKYHSDKLNNIFKELNEKIKELPFTVNRKQYEYFFDIGDGSECKALLIVDSDKSICLIFGNWIH